MSRSVLEVLNAFEYGDLHSGEFVKRYPPQDELEAAAATLERMAEALAWFVANDDTNIGQPGNEYFEAGLAEGIAALRAYRGEQA